MRDIRRIFAVVAVGGALFLSACGGDAGSTGASTTGDFPMTVENCGRSVTIEEEPSRIVTSNTAPVHYVAAVGGLDKIVAVAGLPGDPVFDEATAAKIDNVPVLGGSEGTLSTEAILGTNADLVIGTQNNGGLTFEQLQTVGIPLLVTTGYCSVGGDTDGTNGREDFADIQNDILLYGGLFGTEDQAKQSVANIQSRLAEVKNNLKPATTEPTAAALFLSGDTLAAYGNQSMSHTQFGLLGLRNMFAEVDNRYFEPTLEEIVNSDPDFIEVLTYPEPGQPAPTLEDLKAFPGMTNVTAIKNGDVVFLPFAYSEDSPVAVEGLQRLADGFGLLK